MGYIRDGLVRQMKEVYTPPRAKVEHLIPRNALYDNEEDREDNDE